MELVASTVNASISVKLDFELVSVNLPYLSYTVTTNFGEVGFVLPTPLVYVVNTFPCLS